MFSSSIKYHRYYHYPDVSVSKLINKHDYYLRPLWGNFAETVRVSSEKTGLASCTSFISLVLSKFVELSFLSGALEEILSGQQFRSEYGILMRTRIDSSSSVDSFSSSFPSKNIRPRFYILRINEKFLIVKIHRIHAICVKYSNSRFFQSFHLFHLSPSSHLFNLHKYLQSDDQLCVINRFNDISTYFIFR